MAHSRSGLVSATTIAVVGVSGLLVLAGSAGLFGLSRAQVSEPPAGGAVKAQPEASKSPAESALDPRYVLGFTVKDIEGKDVDLARHKGRVVVIVNVATKCGFTSQYEGIEKLYRENKDKGLVVLGFPANNFGGQEPGSDSEIQEFCTGTFGVSFPMFSKVSVKGDDACELYRKLGGQPAPVGGAPKWNFTKFVVDRSGNVVARYDAARENVRTANLEKDLVAKVNDLLGAS